MKRISDEFCFVDADFLDKWFEEKIQKYPNSVTKDHLEAVYRMMVGETIRNDSLVEKYDRKEV